MRGTQSSATLIRVLAIGVVSLLAGCGSTSRVTLLNLGDACTPGDTFAECRDGLCIALDSQSGF